MEEREACARMAGLKAYDGATVRLTVSDGNVFEGACEWCSPEIAEDATGRAEAALQIDDWYFFESDIRRVERIADGTEKTWMSRTQHRMRLAPRPYRMIEDGQKTIELRLYDEKRRRVRPGDIIRFENTLDETEVMRAEVKKLHAFPSFRELYAALPLTQCGYTQENAAAASPADMDAYYSPEEQKKYGAVGIEIALL